MNSSTKKTFMLNSNNKNKVKPELYKYAIKRFLLLLIPLTLIGVAAFYLTFTLYNLFKFDELDNQTKAAIELARGHAAHDFETVYNDLQFLVNSELNRELLFDHNLSEHRQKIERSFHNLAKTHKMYDQIRLLSDKGNELVRINYNQGDVKVVPQEQLQDKSGRYYFTEASKILDDRVYVSTMDLNIENSIVEFPYKPMVRFAQPIRDSSGKLKGVVVLNYLGNILIDKFRQQMSILPGESMLLNSGGYWLSSENHEQEWAFMFNKVDTFGINYPKVWQQVKNKKNGIVETDKGLFRFATIQALPSELLVDSKTNHALDDWNIIVINKHQGVDTSFLFEHLGYIYPLLIAYPIGFIMLWFLAKTSAGKKVAEYELQELNYSLEEQISQRTKELIVTKEVTILSLATLAEMRDNETGLHIRRTQKYIKVLADVLKSHPEFNLSLDDNAIELIINSAPLHDIGKVGIPDAILLKPGGLTDEEFEVMKKHTTYGSEALKEAINTLSSSLNVASKGTFLNYAKDIANYHHERWDGSGYPEGLVGDAIPLSARMMALADVYDALVSKRVYKKAFSKEVTENIILHESDGQFDPRILKAFDQIKDQFWEIRKRYAEQDDA